MKDLTKSDGGQFEVMSRVDAIIYFLLHQKSSDRSYEEALKNLLDLANHGEFLDPKVIPALAAFLLNDDANVRIYATQIIGRMASNFENCKAIVDTTAISSLVTLLLDSDSDVMEFAYVALLDLLDLQDRHLIVRQRITQALFDLVRNSEKRGTTSRICASSSCIAELLNNVINTRYSDDVLTCRLAVRALCYLAERVKSDDLIMELRTYCLHHDSIIKEYATKVLHFLGFDSEEMVEIEVEGLADDKLGDLDARSEDDISLLTDDIDLAGNNGAPRSFQKAVMRGARELGVFGDSVNVAAQPHETKKACGPGHR
ncbi:MAG: hypothetical protein V4496_05250 [Pseudomonadota bacterium]